MVEFRYEDLSALSDGHLALFIVNTKKENKVLNEAYHLISHNTRTRNANKVLGAKEPLWRLIETNSEMVANASIILAEKMKIIRENPDSDKCDLMDLVRILLNNHKQDDFLLSLNQEINEYKLLVKKLLGSKT